MKQVIRVLLLLILSQNTQASEEFIGSKALLGCHQDSSLTSGDVQYAIYRLDTLMLNTYAKKFVLSPNIKIKKEYSFNEILCIKMIRFSQMLKGEDTLIGSPLQAILLNTCDSTLYPFGGNSANFSVLIREYLSNNFKSDFILKLLKLYLNSIDINESYHVVNSYEDLEQYAVDFLSLDSVKDPKNNFPAKKYISDIRSYQNSIKPIKIEKDSNSYKIELYTWKQYLIFWGLDFWQFEVTREAIRAIDRIKIPPQEY